MDKLSILGDAIDYLKELVKRINDLHTELGLTSPGSFVPPCTSFHPVTPTLQTWVKKELCPKNQSPKVLVYENTCLFQNQNIFHIALNCLELLFNGMFNIRIMV